MQLRRLFALACAILPLLASLALAEPVTYRLYDGLTAFVDNPEGRDFTLTLEVRDLNQRIPHSELLVKVYPPDGRPVVREIIPDDGVSVPLDVASPGGWDHEAWYYATAYNRGLEPLVRWSAFSDPGRLAGMPQRTFSYHIKGGPKGVYRVMLAGVPDQYVTLSVDPDLKYGVAGSPEWVHGHHDLFRKSYVYVPRTANAINVLFLQFDEPADRAFVVKGPDGTVLARGNAADGLVQTSIGNADHRLDDQVLTVEVSEGDDDFLLNLTFQLDGKFIPVRSSHLAVTAVFCPDEATARAVQGGAIYHDGDVFWQMHQVRLHDWLKQLQEEDFQFDRALVKREGFYSVGSHQSPSWGNERQRAVGTADLIMHNWAEHKDPKALNAAIQDMLFGLRLIGHGDHVAIGPKRNLAYEMGTYSFFWYRPAWRIIEQSDAPQEVKDILREFVIQTGDRLAFDRTMATTNGNAFASLMQGVRYCVEASGDPLQTELFETIWDRFVNGGYGDRAGIGPSGGLQESHAYDYHYGSYVLRGWNAVIHDLKDQRFIDARNRMYNLYSYMHIPAGGAGNPWSSRTAITSTAGGTYDPWNANYRWKGFGGPNFVEGVNGHNEWFAARRPTYYMVTYHGRLAPTWEGEGFNGQVGHGGGGISQLMVPGKGQVFSAKPNGDYGGGMHGSQWRNFHIHSMVGTTIDGQPLVTGNSEHWDARIENENTVVSSGPVRLSNVNVERRYTYGPESIACAVRLLPSPRDQLFGLWGGPPRMHGAVTEAYEMIPFNDLQVRAGQTRPEDPKRRTQITPLDAAGQPLPKLNDASVGQSPVQAAGVIVDSGGYGALITFDRVRPLQRGQNDTLLITVAEGRTPAEQVALEYVIVPFVDQPPAMGQVAGAGKTVHKIERLGGTTTLEGMEGALAAAQPFEIKVGEQTLATLRFAVAGEDLALLAQVNDAKVAPQATPWKGSCLEVFGSTYETHAIGQVFLTPAGADRPAAAFVAGKGGPSIADAIRLATTPRQGGYELRALIPLRLLQITPENSQFLLEFQISRHNAQGALAHQVLFDSRFAYESNQGYGLFAYELPEPAAESAATEE